MQERYVSSHFPNMRIRKFLQSDATELSSLMRETVIKSNSQDYSKEAVQCLVDEYTAERLLKDSKRTLKMENMKINSFLETILWANTLRLYQ